MAGFSGQETNAMSIQWTAMKRSPIRVEFFGREAVIQPGFRALDHFLFARIQLILGSVRLLGAGAPFAEGGLARPLIRCAEGSAMTRKLFWGGGLIAALLAAVVFAGSAQHPAQAQVGEVEPVPTVGRYQLSSFVVEGRTPGAYILDTQTGEVVQVVGRDEPVRVGSAAKPRPPK